MDKKIKSTIQWTLYGFGVFILLVGYVIPFSKVVFFNENTPELINWMGWASAGIGILSLILGIISLLLSSNSERQLTGTLNTIRELQCESQKTLGEIKFISKNIKDGQDKFVEGAFNTITEAIKNIQGKKDSWFIDKTGRGE